MSHTYSFYQKKYFCVEKDLLKTQIVVNQSIFKWIKNTTSIMCSSVFNFSISQIFKK